MIKNLDEASQAKGFQTLYKHLESLISFKFSQNNNENTRDFPNNVSGVNEDKYKENEKNALILNNSSNSNDLTNHIWALLNSFLNDSLVDRYNKIDNILDEDEKYRQSKYIEKIFNEQNLNSIDWEYALITRKTI